MEFDTPEYWACEQRKQEEQRWEQEREEHHHNCCHITEEWLLGNITEQDAEQYLNSVDEPPANLLEWAEYLLDIA